MPPALSLAFSVLGGLALFLFGMQVMTAGLKAAAGEKLRTLIYRFTQDRLTGLGLGTGLGFLMHSSATTVMTVGFVNAGLLGLAASLPVLMGANLGTTLSMQLISFKLTDYALVAVAVGGLTALTAPHPLAEHVGRAVFGFGLLFLGMDLMSGAIAPHREALQPWLTYIDGSTWGGLLLGTLVAFLLTLVVQSSGAVIGMAFVLTAAGAFTSLVQVYPIVLGAHLGTPLTALLAALGGGIEARRCAVANLGFNLANVALGLIAAPAFLAAIEATSGDVVRQIANLHTALMLVAALLLLPFTAPLTRLLRRLLPSDEVAAPASFLDPQLLPQPENALTAVIREQRRTLELLSVSFTAARRFAAATDQRRAPALIRRNEQSVDEIRIATFAYLNLLTHRYLSRRQRLLAQYLAHVTADVERIGDHLMHVVDGIENQRRLAPDAYDGPMRKALTLLFDAGETMLALTRASLDVDRASFPAAPLAILAAREAFAERAATIRRAVNQRVAKHTVPAIAGLLFGRQVLAFDALSRHCALIAREELQPFFALKPAKLDRIEPPATQKRRPRDRDAGPPI